MGRRPIGKRAMTSAQRQARSRAGLTPPALPFARQLWLAGQHVHRARFYYDLFWFYRGKPTRDDHIAAMNDFGEFFRYDEHAQFNSFIIYLGRLFDRDPRSISLPVLASKSKPNARLEQLLAAAAPVGEKVRTIRNKAVAHSDNSLDYDAWVKAADVTYVQLREQTEVAREIVNLLLVDNGLHEVYFVDTPVSDLKEMLKVLGELPRRRSMG